MPRNPTADDDEKPAAERRPVHHHHDARVTHSSPPPPREVIDLTVAAAAEDDDPPPHGDSPSVPEPFRGDVALLDAWRRDHVSLFVDRTTGPVGRRVSVPDALTAAALERLVAPSERWSQFLVADHADRERFAFLAHLDLLGRFERVGDDSVDRLVTYVDPDRARPARRPFAASELPDGVTYLDRVAGLSCPDPLVRVYLETRVGVEDVLCVRHPLDADGLETLLDRLFSDEHDDDDDATTTLRFLLFLRVVAVYEGTKTLIEVRLSDGRRRGEVRITPLSEPEFIRVKSGPVEDQDPIEIDDHDDVEQEEEEEEEDVPMTNAQEEEDSKMPVVAPSPATGTTTRPSVGSPSSTGVTEDVATTQGVYKMDTTTTATEDNTEEDVNMSGVGNVARTRPPRAPTPTEGAGTNARDSTATDAHEDVKMIADGDDDDDDDHAKTSSVEEPRAVTPPAAKKPRIEDGVSPVAVSCRYNPPKHSMRFYTSFPHLKQIDNWIVGSSHAVLGPLGTCIYPKTAREAAVLEGLVPSGIWQSYIVQNPADQVVVDDYCSKISPEPRTVLLGDDDDKPVQRPFSNAQMQVLRKNYDITGYLDEFLYIPVPAARRALLQAHPGIARVLVSASNTAVSADEDLWDFVKGTQVTPCIIVSDRGVYKIECDGTRVKNVSQVHLGDAKFLWPAAVGTQPRLKDPPSSAAAAAAAAITPLPAKSPAEKPTVQSVGNETHLVPTVAGLFRGLGTLGSRLFRSDSPRASRDGSDDDEEPVDDEDVNPAKRTADQDGNQESKTKRPRSSPDYVSALDESEDSVEMTGQVERNDQHVATTTTTPRAAHATTSPPVVSPQAIAQIPPTNMAHISELELGHTPVAPNARTGGGDSDDDVDEEQVERVAHHNAEGGDAPGNESDAHVADDTLVVDDESALDIGDTVSMPEGQDVAEGEDIIDGQVESEAEEGEVESALEDDDSQGGRSDSESVDSGEESSKGDRSDDDDDNGSAAGDWSQYGGGDDYADEYSVADEDEPEAPRNASRCCFGFLFVLVALATIAVLSWYAKSFVLDYVESFKLGIQLETRERDFDFMTVESHSVKHAVDSMQDIVEEARRVADRLTSLHRDIDYTMQNVAGVKEPLESLKGSVAECEYNMMDFGQAVSFHVGTLYMERLTLLSEKGQASLQKDPFGFPILGNASSVIAELKRQGQMIAEQAYELEIIHRQLAKEAAAMQKERSSYFLWG